VLEIGGWPRDILLYVKVPHSSEYFSERLLFTLLVRNGREP
jgi:hypothetical protein